MQDIQKIDEADPEKNASLTDGQTTKWMDEKDWFYRTLLQRSKFDHVFRKFENKIFLRNMERIDTRKRNTIDMDQCSQSSKIMILSKFTQDNFHIVWPLQIPSRRTTSFQRLIDVETTMCVYWISSLIFISLC